MDLVLRAVAVYIVLLVIFRFAGRRTLSDMTAFDFILLLVVSEGTQQALIGDDSSVLGAVLVVLTLVSLDIAFSLLKQRSARMQKWMEGVPSILVEHGRPVESVMRRARVREEEVLEAARRLQGLERMDQIKFAVLEVSGGITIVPNDAG
jgi:uncharacterized membrane protein YcaP (DUF421 family)